MRLEVVGTPMDDFFPGVFVLGIGSEIRPPRGESGLLDWRLAGAISALVRDGQFAGSNGEMMLFWSERRQSKIYLFGTGAASSPSNRAVADCVENMVRVLLNADESVVTLLAQHLLGDDEDVERALAFLSGLTMAGESKRESLEAFRLLIPGDKSAKKYYEVLRKALLRKGKDAEGVELVFSEGAQTLQLL